MNEWKHSQKADRVTFLPDGNGDFTDGMGQLVDKQDLGFGKRSWRYSMLVRDGVIEKMFIESDEPGDPFSVSDADTMLNLPRPETQIVRMTSPSSLVRDVRSVPRRKACCATQALSLKSWY